MDKLIWFIVVFLIIYFFYLFFVILRKKKIAKFRKGVEVSILDVTPAYIATSIEMRGDQAKLRERRDIGDAVELVDNSPAEPADPTPNLGLEQQKLLKRKFDFYLLCN